MKIVSFTSIAMVVGIVAFLIFATGKSFRYVPVEGIVTAKEWVPEHEVYSPVYVPDGQGGLITVANWYTEQERWVIHVGSRYACVSKAEFKTIEIQGYFKERE